MGAHGSRLARSRRGADAQVRAGEFRLHRPLGAGLRRKAEPGNPHLITSVLRTGGVELRNKLGAEYEDNVNIVLEARSLGPDRVWIKSQLNNNEMREWEVMRQGGRILTMVNRKPDGTLITKDGVVVASNKPTPWLNRCK